MVISHDISKDPFIKSRRVVDIQYFSRMKDIKCSMRGVLMYFTAWQWGCVSGGVNLMVAEER